MDNINNDIINPSAGDQTNVWYEWYVGIDYLIELINPNSMVCSVLFQSDDAQKLDDVVIKYNDGKQKRFQVKHTTENKEIGLATLISEYLEEFSKEWARLYNDTNDLKFILYTNRKSSNAYNGNKNIGVYLRPALNEFWNYIKSTLSNVKCTDDIVMKDSGWNECWKVFLGKIEHLKSDKKDLRLKFLENFDIQLEQPNLLEHENSLLVKIKDMYGVDDKRANDILDRLKSKLSEWVTKEGKIKRPVPEVTHEMIIQSLFETGANRCVGNHNLPVIANGFESRKKFAAKLKKILTETSKKIVFLSGNPQSGKTTLVSYLYSVEKAIDFRFHAFKPIMVDGSKMGNDKGVSTHKGLWGDLYIQIIEYIYKNSIKLNNSGITPFVDWLEDDRLQSETLRILGELSATLKRKIIVAIDGIDHAARSGEKETFLDRFCYPDNIPDNVCLLIAGQPWEGYKDNYPSWIVDNQYVESCNIPPIEKDDITLLLSNLPDTLDKFIIKDIIYDVSNGNTLSAVFAAKEAEKCQNIQSFKEVIESRNLKCGVEEYYKTIWKYCKEKIVSFITTKEFISQIELSIAVVLSIIEQPLNIELFSEINKELELPNGAWESIAGMLYPLVIFINNDVCVENNDVRVFLKGQTKNFYSDEKLDSIKIKLANCFYSKSEYIYERHYLNYDLLKSSSNKVLFAESLNGEYIAEALAMGQKIEDIRSHIQFAISTSLSNKRDNLLVNICAALKVFEQFKKSTEYAGYSYKEAINDFYFLNGEITLRQDNYSFKELESAINDALVLYENRKLERCRTIVNRHFLYRNVCDIINMFCNDKDGKKVIYPYFNVLIIKLGKICRYCEINIFNNFEGDKIDKIQNEFLNSYFKGWFEASADWDNIDDSKTFSILPMMNIGEELFVFLKNEYKDGRWSFILKNMELLFSYKLQKPVALQLTSWLIQNRAIDSSHKSLDDIKVAGINYLDDVYFGSIDTNEYKLMSFVNLYFCLGYCGIKYNINYSINNYYNFYYTDERKMFKLMLWTNFRIGSAFIAFDSNCLEDCKIIIKAHLKSTNVYYPNLYVYDYANDVLYKLMKLSETANDFRKYLFVEFKNKLVCLKNQVKWDYIISPIIIPFLYSLGENKEISEYMQKIAGSEGTIWSWSLTDRTYSLPIIEHCAKVIEMPIKFMQQINEYKRWFANGYSGAKEDVQFDLYTCVRAILDIEPKLWKKYLDETIYIVSCLSEVSDVNDILNFYKLFGSTALSESLDSLYQLLKVAKITNDDKIHVLYLIFCDLLYKNKIESVIALAMWKFFYKHFKEHNKYDAYDQKWLRELKQAVQSYCQENGFDLNLFYEINEIRIYQVSKTTLEDTKIYSGSLDEMLNKLVIDSSKHLLRGADCLKYLERIENERPTEFKSYVEQISRLIGEEKIGYTLTSSGYDNAFSKLYELLDDGKKFVFLGNVMNTHKSEKDMSNWAHIIHDILLHFYLHYHKSNLSKVEKMLNSNIGVHKLILTGNGIVKLPEIYIHETDAIYYSTNWFDVLELLN